MREVFIPIHLLFREISKILDLTETAARCSEGSYNQIGRQNWGRIFSETVKAILTQTLDLTQKQWPVEVRGWRHRVSPRILRSKGVGTSEKILKIWKNAGTNHSFWRNIQVYTSRLKSSNLNSCCTLNFTLKWFTFHSIVT